MAPILPHGLTDFKATCETEGATEDTVFRLFLRGCDLAYRWLHGLLDPAAQVGEALRVELACYRGPTLTLADGTKVRPGDRIGIIHLRNERVAALHGDGSETPTAGLKFRRAFVASLAELARRVGESDRYVGVKAFTAETILHRGTQRAGFEILPIPSATWSRLVAAYERALLTRYHPLGRRRASRLRFSEARAIWISRTALLRRYAPERSVPSGTSS